MDNQELDEIGGDPEEYTLFPYNEGVNPPECVFSIEIKEKRDFLKSYISVGHSPTEREEKIKIVENAPEIVVFKAYSSVLGGVSTQGVEKILRQENTFIL